MILDIFKLLIFSFLINYLVSLQIVSQSLENKRQRVAAIFLMIIFGILSGAIILWI